MRRPQANTGGGENVTSALATQINAEKTQLDIELTKLGDVKKKHQSDVEVLENEKQSVENRVLELKSNIGKLKEQVKDLAVKHSRALEDRQRELSKLEVSILAKNSERDELGASYTKLNTFLAELKREVLEVEGSKKSLLLELSQLRIKSETLVAEGQAREEKIAELEKIVVKKGSEIEGLDKAIEERGARLGDLSVAKQELSQTRKLIDSEKSALKELRGEQEKARKALVASEDKHQKVLEDSAERLRVVAGAEARLDQKIAYYQKLIEKGKMEGYLKDKGL